MDYFEGDNIGSIAKLEIAFPFAFSSFYPAVLKAGQSWENVPVDSGSLTLKSSESDNGTVYTYSATAAVHNMRDEVDAVLHKFLDCGCIAKVTDMNGRRYILGAPDYPAGVSVSGTTGTKVTDENGTDVKISIEQHYTAPRE